MPAPLEMRPCGRRPRIAGVHSGMVTTQRNQAVATRSLLPGTKCLTMSGDRPVLSTRSTRALSSLFLPNETAGEVLVLQ